ncbi:MAG: hypothetical protein SVW02_04265 [Candidatus Nanohaloarchaea archaeon]|nr:hypothetical protein [Candidatus Nanohaloarchaea archaeon]
MDEATREAAEQDAFRHVLLDLEEAVRNQNQLLRYALGFATFWSVIALYYLYKLDQFNLFTKLLVG